MRFDNLFSGNTYVGIETENTYGKFQTFEKKKLKYLFRWFQTICDGFYITQINSNVN